MPNIITARPKNFYIKKIYTTNRESKVDTSPQPRWTLNKDLCWKM